MPCIGVPAAKSGLPILLNKSRVVGFPSCRCGHQKLQLLGSAGTSPAEPCQNKIAALKEASCVQWGMLCSGMPMPCCTGMPGAIMGGMPATEATRLSIAQGQAQVPAQLTLQRMLCHLCTTAHLPRRQGQAGLRW